VGPVVLHEVLEKMWRIDGALFLSSPLRCESVEPSWYVADDVSVRVERAESRESRERESPGTMALTYESVTSEILKALPHKGGAMELKHKAPEVTFLGADQQPDFATLYVTFYPTDTVIELKSLKRYLYQFRSVVISYERFLDVVFEHMLEAYQPARLRLVLITQPRGGISSKLTIDSDWAIRGGKEEWRDWVGMEDVW
jgi:7-cyano-7-deazaguanine reductase